MFQALQPLLEERNIHLMLSVDKGGQINLFVQPVKRHDKEDDAFTVPFRVTRPAADLDQNLAGIITQWIECRAPMVAQLGNELAVFEQQQKDAAEAAKKKAAAKKPGSTAVTPTKVAPKSVTPTVAKPATPSLFDAPASCADADDDGDDDGDGNAEHDAATPDAPEAVSDTPLATAQAAPEPAPQPASAPQKSEDTPAPILASVVSSAEPPSLF